MEIFSVSTLPKSNPIFQLKNVVLNVLQKSCFFGFEILKDKENVERSDYLEGGGGGLKYIFRMYPMRVGEVK